MTDLQIILLISSGAFLAGLYWWGKKTKEHNNAIRSQNLRKHGFRAETPEEEGMEVTMQPARPPRTAPAVTVSARDALARASGQNMRDADAENPIGQPSSASVAPQRETMIRPSQDHGAIQGVMSNHADPYLEERFALSDPITPRHVVSSGRDQMQHHLSDTHLPEMPFDATGHQHHGYGRQEMKHYPEYHEHSYDQHTAHHSQDRHDKYESYDSYDNYDEPIVEPSLPAQIFALLVIDPIRSFSRRDIHNAMLGAGLVFSSNGVYVFSDKQGNAIFRVANVNEPGYFPELEDNPDEFSTVGVALVLELPAAVTPYRAMNEFITAARRISQSLGGNLYDAQRRLIKESHLREMREYAQSIT